MLADISSVDAIYIVCGRTDMRKSIDGCVRSSRNSFRWRSTMHFFIFCGRKCDRIKANFKRTGWNRYDLQKTDCPRFLPVAQK